MHSLNGGRPKSFGLMVDSEVKQIELKQIKDEIEIEKKTDCNVEVPTISAKFTFDYTDFINEMATEDGAGSAEDGLKNTTYMFSYSGNNTTNTSGGMDLYNYFINSLGGTATSTFKGNMYSEFATKEALKKNKVRVNIGSTSEGTVHSPLIESNRTDLWYLPATSEVGILQNNSKMIESVETLMEVGDIFWTSRAAEGTNAYSYIWGNPGSTPTADRDNAYRVRAIRQKPTTNN